MKILIDESDRRSLNQNLPQMNDKQICSQYLFVEMESRIQEIVKSELEKVGHQDHTESYKENLQMAKKRDAKQINKEFSEMNLEELKTPANEELSIDEDQDKSKKDKVIDQTLPEKILDIVMSEKQYLKLLEDEDSNLSKLIAERTKTFFKFNFWFSSYCEYFFGVEDEFYKTLKEKKLPMSKLELAAIMLQNLQNPKSSHKKTSIEKKKYITIVDEKSALEYIETVIKSIIEKTASSSSKKVEKYLRVEKHTKLSKIFCETEDIEEAAAILKGCKIGSGDVNIYLDAICNNKTSIALEKVKMINEGVFKGTQLFSDVVKPKEEEKTSSKKKSKKNNKRKKSKVKLAPNSSLSKKKIFKLWRALCKKQKAVKESDFFEYFSTNSKLDYTKVNIVFIIHNLLIFIRLLHFFCTFTFTCIRSHSLLKYDQYRNQQSV